MTTEPQQPHPMLVVTILSDAGARRALEAVKTAGRERQIHMHDTALLRRSADGKLHVRDLQDVTGVQGAVVGAIEGALLGLIAGPAGAVAGAAAGALTGGVSASLFELGMPHAALERIAADVQPGQTALIVLVDEAWAAATRAVLEPFGAVQAQALKPSS